MKKIYLMGILLSNGFAYTQPIGSPPATNTNARASAAWYRGGNELIGNGNNIFGTRWKSDIYIMTDNRYIAQFTSENGLNTAIFGHLTSISKLNNIPHLKTIKKHQY